MIFFPGLLWCGVFLLVSAAASAQSAPPDVRVSASVSQSEIGIADRIDYSVRVEHPAAGEADLPGLVGNLGAFEVKGLETHDENVGSGRKARTWTAHISAYVTGEFPIGSQEVVYRTARSDGGYDSLVLATTPVLVKVIGRLSPADTGMLDSELPLAPPTRPWWMWALVGVALAVALFFAIRALWRWWRRPRVIRTLNPWEEAQQELTRLRADGVPEGESADQRPWFDSLSLVLRTYLQRRFNVDALDATTMQLRSRLEGAQWLTPARAELLWNLFADSDRVRFARFTLPSLECLAHLATVESLVQDTIPTPEELARKSAPQTPGGVAEDGRNDLQKESASGRSQGGPPPSENQETHNVVNDAVAAVKMEEHK